MMEVQRVTVQIRRPAGTDAGQVSEGFYIVEDGVLTLVNADGSALERPHRHTLREGDSVEAIARVLIKKARREILGLTEAQEAFGRTLRYARGGVA